MFVSFQIHSALQKHVDRATIDVTRAITFFNEWRTLEGADYTANDGAIVLCHMKQKTLDAMRVVVPALIENRYQLVTVSEMFEAFGYDAVPYDGNLGKTPVARR